MSVRYLANNRSATDHSYEEIRRVALDILANREAAPYSPDQFEHLLIDVADVFERREGRGGSGQTPTLSDGDSKLFQEIFWDFFRQGIITLGLNRANAQYPFFRISSFGERILAGQDAYFFHDVSSFEKVINDEIPNIDEVTLFYLKEAMQAFMSGCILSSCVMLGVATEHTFLVLVEAINGSAVHSPTFAAVGKERQILGKINKFRSILEKHLSSLTPAIREDLDTNFAGILAMIRTFRNDSGHPSGKIVSREQAYVNLQLFVPYCKKMYQLMDYYR